MLFFTRYNVDYNSNILSIDRKECPNFIPGFFQSKESTTIANITAIVGKNGTGKSNLLDALKWVLSNDENRILFKYVLIYKIEKDVLIKHNFKKNRNVWEELNDKSELISVSNDKIKTKIKASFKYMPDKALSSETIYYNPALDNRIYPITYDHNWIDISTDWLIFNDYKEHHSLKPEKPQIELFESQEIERQLLFINDLRLSESLKNKIQLPTEIRILSLANDFPTKINDNTSTVRNVPYFLRECYDELDKMCEKAINNYADNEYSSRMQSFEKEVEYTRKKCFATFLSHLLKNIFYHLEISNRHVAEDNRNNISINTFKSLSYEDAVLTFIESVHLFEPANAFVEFVTYCRNLILNSRVEYVTFLEIAWISPIETIGEFIRLRDEYLKLLDKFIDYDYPKSFVVFSWHGMSTGERAMLNLHSRFLYAKSEIIRKYNENKINKKQIPNTLYLLIDEGELGFHPQWQKEYVFNIIDILPHVLDLGKEFNTNKKIGIQIIFTTHSMMSLSDILNSNIVYIDKNENGAYVLQGEEKPKKSFGANVHSLLSNSFFLGDGLVGNFAKQKINEVIQLIRVCLKTLKLLTINNI